METKKPFLSIVIANYNYGEMLGTAIESVISQDCKDFELIVVDGGSKDNSVEVIQKYNEHIYWWVSEADNGQSHAFNKGFAKARGEFITWLNADDILLPGTISAVKKALQSKPSADYATGNMCFFLNDNHKIIATPWGPNILPYWLQGPGRKSIVYGPTTFWRRSVYEKLGPIDETLHYTMDTEYWYRMMMAGHKQVRVNHYCWGFRFHENSKTAAYEGHEHSDKHKKTVPLENEYIRKKTGYSPKKFWIIISYLFRILDGSMIISLYNKMRMCGKTIDEQFKLPYSL